MTRFLALLLLASPAFACEVRDGLPDPQCSPGGTDPHVTQENIHETIHLLNHRPTVLRAAGQHAKVWEYLRFSANKSS